MQTDDQTENKQEKSKNDDPVVDLFPDDENEERNSKLFNKNNSIYNYNFYTFFW